VCPHCGGLARLSDKTRILEALGSEVLAIALIISILVRPWWMDAILGGALLVGLVALLDVVFPLVAAEPFGSAAYNRRAAIHFWLIAPLFFLVVVAIYIAIFRG